MARDDMTFVQALFIFVVAYALFFFLFAAADTLFFSPDLQPTEPGVGIPASFSMNSLGVMFLISILGIFIVGAIIYYIISSH